MQENISGCKIVEAESNRVSQAASPRDKLEDFLNAVLPQNLNVLNAPRDMCDVNMSRDMRNSMGHSQALACEQRRCKTNCQVLMRLTRK